MKSSPPRSAVSVVSTVLNEREDIGALISSLAGQTLAPSEIIIVDGGSTDGTWECLEAARIKYRNLILIRDPSCSLKHTPGPIARGRNVGVAAATSEVIACADAGCTYHPEWLSRLTKPIVDPSTAPAAEYAVGGSYTDPANATVWDIASAPFFGVKLNAASPTKSCTARSMAFRKELWQLVAGFSEAVWGDDSEFDAKVRKLITPAFPERAKAMYRPRHTFSSALRQMVAYSLVDGAQGGRSARLWRNIARCLAEILAVAVLVYSAIPLLCLLALEVYFAFRLDWNDFRRFALRKAPLQRIAARLVYSLLVPWIVAWYQSVGTLTKKSIPNRQNCET